jgi:hypothetical protein
LRPFDSKEANDEAMGYRREFEDTLRKVVKAKEIERHRYSSKRGKIN